MAMLMWLVLGCGLIALIDASTWAYPLKAICKISVFISFPVVWSMRFPHWPKVRWSLPNRHRVIKLIWLALVEIGLILGVLSILLPFLDTSMIMGVLRDNFANQPWVFAGVTLYIVIINAGLEEWYFRGFGYLRLRHLLSKQWAIAISATLFSAYHVALMAGLFPWPLYWTLVAGLVGVGAVFCWLDEQTGSLWPSFVVHASANLAMNLVAMHWLGFL